MDDDDNYHEFKEEQQSHDNESVKDRVNCKNRNEARMIMINEEKKIEFI